MPNFLRLTDIETGQAYEGRDLITVDEKLCAALDQPVSPDWFLGGWVDWLELYLCDDWAEVIRRNEEAKSPDGKMAIIRWLAEHYTLNSYAMIGRC